MGKIKVDPQVRNRFLFSFLMYFLVFWTIGSFTGTIILIKISLPFSIILSIITTYIVGKLGSTSGTIYWPTKTVPPQEQFSADLAKARFCKAKGQYKEAISLLNEILKQYPTFPDALWLKGQILWEGFENKDAALKNLEKVIELVQDDDPIQRWAINYYYDLKKGQKIKK